jgi:hypothetical protein
MGHPRTAVPRHSRQRVNIGIAIISHRDRHQLADELVDQLGTYDIPIYEDSGGLGCEANHARAWEDFAGQRESIDWAVVLEEDAQPVPGFRQQLEAALAVAPAPIVSLYLGTGYPKGWQPKIRDAINTIGTANWLITNTTIHAVGLAIRTDLLPLKLDQHVAIDAAIGNWAKSNDHLVAYSWPSLVDHADGPTLVTTRHSSNANRDEPRKAWQVGTRPQWTSRCKALT